MVAMAMSCDPQKLEKVMAVSRLVMKGFYGLTEEDKEEIMLDVWYRFEMDQAKFPVAVYARHCKNKVIGFLGKKTAQKRMAQKIVNGTRVYFEDVSLNLIVGDEQDTEFGDMIAADDSEIAEVELLAEVEMRAPELVPLIKRVLQGDALSREEKSLLRKKLKKDNLF